MSHFAQFLHESGQLEEFISNCPLAYKSNNAPEVKDILGTIILSVLSGHIRYSHMSSLYGDEIAADLLDMNKIMSHDSVQRGLDKIVEKDAQKWLDISYRKMYEPLLTAPYILDLDPTVKVMYGQQEGAEIGYNPQKPGRPSQSYHTYFIGNLRLVLDVEIHSGKEVAGCYSHPRLWSLIDSMPVQCLPHLIRGDIGFGNEGTMLGCEERDLFFLFKLKQTKNIKSLILNLEKPGENWRSVGQGWFGSEGEIQLMG